jgi:hypothetical protein
MTWPVVSTGELQSNPPVVLISCVKKKKPEQETPCAAKDLYRSTLFKAQRELAQALSQQWSILSAKYGLLHPDEQVEWYECTLNGQPIAKKKDWAKSVSISLLGAPNMRAKTWGCHQCRKSSSTSTAARSSAKKCAMC